MIGFDRPSQDEEWGVGWGGVMMIVSTLQHNKIPFHDYHPGIILSEWRPFRFVQEHRKPFLIVILASRLTSLTFSTTPPHPLPFTSTIVPHPLDSFRAPSLTYSYYRLVPYLFPFLYSHTPFPVVRYHSTTRSTFPVTISTSTLGVYIVLLLSLN